MHPPQRLVAGQPVQRVRDDEGHCSVKKRGAGDVREVVADDDDVVARQIREAAMKEKDPELREKLWDEYRKYTGSVKR